MEIINNLPKLNIITKGNGYNLLEKKITKKVPKGINVKFSYREKKITFNFSACYFIFQPKNR